MKHRWKRWPALCLAAVGTFALGLQAQSQQQPPPQPTEITAQIDALLKKANEQMHQTAQLKDAEESARHAVELSRTAGDRPRTMRSLFALSSVCFYVGRFTEALEIGQQVLALARDLNDKRALSVALNGEASILRALGRFEEAVADFDQTSALARELADLPMQWTIARNVGVLYMEMGDVDRAEAPLKDALRIAGELADPKWKNQVPDGGKLARAASLETLGNWEYGREHYTASAAYLEEALGSKPEVPAFVAEILNNLANARQKLGDAQKAVDLLQEAVKLWASTGAPPHPVMLTDLAAAQESAGLLDDARAGQERALNVVRESGGNAQYEWLIESRLAHVERAMGRSASALDWYQTAARTIERLRSSALNTESGRAFAAATRRTVYEDAADLLHDLHRDGEALEFAERGRARAFLEVLAESRTGVINELTPDQRTREDAILARISAAQKNQWKPNLSASDKRSHELALSAAEADLDVLHREVRRSNPRYADLQYPQPIGLRQLQTQLLDDGTVFVEYLLGEKRSLAWVVSHSAISAIELAPRKALEAQASAYRELLARPVSTLTLRASLAEIDRAGNELYRSVFAPLAAAIGSARRLIIVPDGGLDYLPFEALVAAPAPAGAAEARPSFLVQRAAVVYAPSASALVALRASSPGRSVAPKLLLAFGDPIAVAQGDSPRSGVSANTYAERGFSLARLPYARDEVLAIGKLFPASQQRVYLGADAREETVKAAALGDYRYIHFASHGFLDEMKPGRSGILFSHSSDSAEDGILQVGEIMRLQMQADLVTLSACSTGLGRLINGEGMLGLTRAMFYAGARNVSVSLWNVNDAATATLMASFYRNLKAGQAKGDAIRQAKLSLLKGPHRLWQHPYFWAAFVIQGEGR